MGSSLTRTTSQNSRFHTLIALRKLDREDKQELVKEFTHGRETSSSRMTIDEMEAAIKHLESEQDASIKKMRAKILNIARDVFGLDSKAKFEQVNYDAVNTFLDKKYKAKLHELTYDQLIKAVTSMERWRESETSKMVNSLLNNG